MADKQVADAAVIATVDTIASSTANSAVSTTTVASAPTAITSTTVATSATTTTAVSVSNAGGKVRRRKPQEPQKRQVLLFIWMFLFP